MNLTGCNCEKLCWSILLSHWGIRIVLVSRVKIFSVVQVRTCISHLIKNISSSLVPSCSRRHGLPFLFFSRLCPTASCCFCSFRVGVRWKIVNKIPLADPVVIWFQCSVCWLMSQYWLFSSRNAFVASLKTSPLWMLNITVLWYEGTLISWPLQPALQPLLWESTPYSFSLLWGLCLTGNHLRDYWEWSQANGTIFNLFLVNNKSLLVKNPFEEIWELATLLYPSTRFYWK